MIETVRKVKVISQSDQERVEIEMIIRRHETGLLKELRRFHRRFPKDAERLREKLTHTILLTGQTE